MEVQNTSTGDLHLVGIIKRPKHREPFTMLFSEALLTMLTSPLGDLTKVELRTWLFLVAQGGYENRVSLYVKDVAAALRHDRAEVGRALAYLTAQGFITVIAAQRGRERTYLLNPELTFRGLPGQRAAVRKRWASLPSEQVAKATE